MPGRRSLFSFVAPLAVGLALTALSSAQASTTTKVARSLPARAWTPKPSASATASPAARDHASSCPTPTPGQASTSTPGAPTQVHAIEGDQSVTVTWCPPAVGQGNVTSYTITSSDGTQVNAQVPNDYVIVDGLTDGRSYSFTVTANTSGGSGAASAASDTVRPAPVPGPRHVLLGKPQSVGYDQYSLMIGGKRTVIYSGEFDPWRTPSPSLWLDRLEKMKADGFNAVTPYFDWDYHSPAPGDYDFTGIRDINTFLNDAQKAGLYVIARPGPYINAETDAGGFPGWLVTQSGTARTDAPDYVAAAEQWLSEVDPIIAAHQITRGGDVILYQVENELFYNEPATVNYMADLIAKVKADGIDVPLTGNHSGTYNGTSGAVDIDGYDSYPQGFNCADPSTFSSPGGFSPFAGEPLMLPEFQGGSYDSWGGSGYDNCYEMTNSDFENVFYKSNFAAGVTIQSNYMTVGGTNWGWLPAPFMYTSYDYGSAIRESGEIGTPSDPNDIAGSKYGENKLLGDFLQSVPSLAKTQGVAAPASSNSAVSTEARANLDDNTQFVYLRQRNASSTSDVSTHLALNTEPSFGYTYDDTDPALHYTGTWTHASNQSFTGGDYKDTESYSDTTGDSMSVTFTGTAVQYIAPTTYNHGIADISLDGGPVTAVDGYSSGTDFQQVLYSASGLPDTTHTLTITVSGQKNPASSGTFVSVDAINVPTAAQQADYYPTVPQQPGTSITLRGRDARLLLTNFAFDGQQLQYSTSELMTHAELGDSALALLYGPAGTDGETVLRYSSQPTVNVVQGGVQSTWDPTRGDLRLDYTHRGLAEVQISGGGRPPLELLIAEKNVAEDFWPESTSAGPVARTGRLPGADRRLGPRHAGADRRHEQLRPDHRLGSRGHRLGDVERSAPCARRVRPTAHWRARSPARRQSTCRRSRAGASASRRRRRSPSTTTATGRSPTTRRRPTRRRRSRPRCCTPTTMDSITGSSGTAATSPRPGTRPGSRSPPTAASTAPSACGSTALSSAPTRRATSRRRRSRSRPRRCGRAPTTSSRCSCRARATTKTASTARRRATPRRARAA